MNEQEKHKNLYTLTDIEQYLQGRLSPAAMHELEKAALQDPFLADAIEGYQSTNLEAAKEDLAGIHHQLSSGPAKVIPVAIKRNLWWRIAAALIVLAATGGLSWFLVNRGSDKQELAQQHTPVSLLKKDTIQTLPTVQIITKKDFRKHIHKQDMLVNNQKQDRSIKEDTSPETATAYNKAAEKTITLSRDYNSGLLATHPKNTIITENLKKSIVASPMLQDSIAGLVVQPQNTRSGITFGDNSVNIDRKTFYTEAKINSSKLSVLPDTSKQFLTLNENVLEKTKPDAVKLEYQTLPSPGQQKLSKQVTVLPIDPGSVTITGNVKADTLSGSFQVVPFKLKDSTNTLADVVVIGYGTQRKKDISGSIARISPQSNETIPEGGWEPLLNYLTKKINTPTGKNKNIVLHGAVEVELTLKDGKVLDAAIIKTFNDSLSRTLIQALKHGPVWISSISPGHKEKRTVHLAL